MAKLVNAPTGSGAKLPTPPDSHFQREWERVGPSVRKLIMMVDGLDKRYAKQKFYEHLPAQPRIAFTTWLEWEKSGSVSVDRPFGGKAEGSGAGRPHNPADYEGRILALNRFPGTPGRPNWIAVTVQAAPTARGLWTVLDAERGPYPVAPADLKDLWQLPRKAKEQVQAWAAAHGLDLTGSGIPNAATGSGAAPAWHDMADVAARAWTHAKRADRLVMLAQLAQMRWLPARLAQMLADPFTPNALVDTEWSGLDAGIRDALAGRPGPAREVGAGDWPGSVAGGGVDSPPAPPGFDLKAGIKKAFRTAPGVAWLIGADNSGHWRAWRVDATSGALQWNGPGRTGRMVAELDALADHQAFKAPEGQAPIDFSRAAELTSPEGPAIRGGKQMKMIVHATCPATGAGALLQGATMKRRRKAKGKGGKVKASGALPEVRDDVERLIDKYRLLHVLEAIQEVADEKADFIIETWQDQHGARVWKQAARKVAAAGRAIARLRAIGL